MTERLGPEGQKQALVGGRGAHGFSGGLIVTRRLVPRIVEGPTKTIQASIAELLAEHVIRIVGLLLALGGPHLGLFDLEWLVAPARTEYARYEAGETLVETLFIKRL